MADEDLENVIEENAAGPAEARGDQGSMRQHSLRDQIEADKYLAGQAQKSGSRAELALGRSFGPPAPIRRILALCSGSYCGRRRLFWSLGRW